MSKDLYSVIREIYLRRKEFKHLNDDLVNELLLKAEDDEEKEFYMMISNYFLGQGCMEVVKNEAEYYKNLGKNND